MIKGLFAILLLSTLLFFGFIRWGEKLTDQGDIQPQQTLQEKISLLPPTRLVDTAAPTAAAVSAVVSAASLPAAPVCMEWGEFSGDTLKRAMAALVASNLDNRLTQRPIEHTSGYWVYMPPRASRAEVDRKIAELKALGITEYFVMQEGKWQNAISLGIFKTSDAAQKFLESLMEQGVKTALIGERTSTLTVTAFILNSPDAEMAGKMAELQKRFAGSTLKSMACVN
jgi:hypothetical protein